MSDVKIRVQFGRYWLEVEAKSAKDALTSLSQYAEVFSELQCGNCNCENLRPHHRLNKDGDSYYKLVCCDCGHHIEIGQYKKPEGSVFLKRSPDGVPADKVKKGWYFFRDHEYYANQNQGGGNRGGNSGGNRGGGQEEPF